MGPERVGALLGDDYGRLGLVLGPGRPAPGTAAADVGAAVGAVGGEVEALVVAGETGVVEIV